MPQKESIRMLPRSSSSMIFKCEVVAYFSVYLGYLLHGLRAMLMVRKQIIRRAKIEFSPGWFFVGQQRDDSNDELENFNVYVQTRLPWYVVHFVASILIRKWWPQRQSAAHAFVSAAALISTQKPVSTILLGILVFSFYSIAHANSKKYVWVLAGLWVLCINLMTKHKYLYTSLEYLEYYTLIITLYWTLLRCSSFVLSRIEEKANSETVEAVYTLEHFLGYILYFPTLVYGPFMRFSRYITCMHSNEDEIPRKQTNKLKTFLFELGRAAFWWFVMELALHFFYIHYMAHDISAIKLVGGPFDQHAVGYFMGQFFFLFYLITYGLGIAFARFDGLDPPSRPRCIGRIHYYSDMWKYFDEGLYEFLFKHIYQEISKKHSKLLATAATFAFVFVWHGCYTYVLLWSALNFCCLVAEKVLKTIVSSRQYLFWVNKYMSPTGAQRLYALLASQLFIPAAFSNVYFIGGLEVGNLLMKNAYMSGMGNYVALTFCCYCFFQCSEIITNFKTRH